jgi:hypothetical protein
VQRQLVVRVGERGLLWTVVGGGGRRWAAGRRGGGRRRAAVDPQVLQNGVYFQEVFPILAILENLLLPMTMCDNTTLKNQELSLFRFRKSVFFRPGKICVVTCHSISKSSQQYFMCSPRSTLFRNIQYYFGIKYQKYFRLTDL